MPDNQCHKIWPELPPSVYSTPPVALPAKDIENCSTTLMVTDIRTAVVSPHSINSPRNCRSLVIHYTGGRVDNKSDNGPVLRHHSSYSFVFELLWVVV